MDQKIELAKSILDYIGRIRANVPRMSDLYRKNKIIDVTDLMLDLVDGIEWMISAISIIDKDADFGKDGLVEILPQMHEALENSDYNLLADILEYELIPVSDNIEKGCSKLVSGSLN